MPGPAGDSTAQSPDDAAGGKAPANEALDLMVEALRLIDLSDGAGVAGAHLDLAIHRLREWIESGQPK